VREQHAPAVAKPRMEADAAFARILLEVRGDIAKTQSHVLFS
jgi:hypothetical protein